MTAVAAEVVGGQGRLVSAVLVECEVVEAFVLTDQHIQLACQEGEPGAGVSWLDEPSPLQDPCEETPDQSETPAES